MSFHHSKGFTLIEVLVALAIFGVLTLLAYTTLGQTFSNAEFLNDRMDRLQAIQRTVRYLNNDLTAAAPRPIRSELGDSYMPALMVSAANDFALAITHGSWSNPAGLPRSTLQRSVYMLEDDELYRIYYNVLDATYSSDTISTKILDEVLSFEILLYDDNGQVTNQWPPLEAQGDINLTIRPRAVEVILTLKDEGEIRRIIEIAS
ncbi:MAG: type II secretion system minor pseudopilin GspJ [Woeseiaceae bacterium]|jgi:general secretion pathway protein J|nr:type II secretion system minor pseudopilin GspJ [Woeseiaceae bacterium]